jgi:DNA-binding FadR family transcriptional regulator
MENNNEVIIKKRGRKPKNQTRETVINKEQSKFFVDLSNEQESLSLIFDFLLKCNEKNYGRPILFKDICIYAVSKLTDKDVDKIQEVSLSEMEKVQRALDDYNKKNGQKLDLGEFLVKKLGIN